MNEISKVLRSKVTGRLDYAKDLIQQALTYFEAKDILRAASPFPSELGALKWSRADDMSWKSQFVYNNYFHILAEDILREYILLDISSPQASLSISDTGFSLNSIPLGKEQMRFISINILFKN